MKNFFIAFLLLLCIFFSACGTNQISTNVVATTLPIYEFTSQLCVGTDITVTQLVAEEISCIHDYSLNVKQLRTIESCNLIILNGMGLDTFVKDILPAGKDILQIGNNIESDHDHNTHEHHHGDCDPHIWLNPENARKMCTTIYHGLSQRYPQYADIFASNLNALTKRLEELDIYAKEELSDLSCRELITFHDGFQNLAEAYGLTILQSIEEESGSEASAAQLKELIYLVRKNDLSAIFTEKNGSCSAAQIISSETGVAIYQLDMALSGESYFDAMYNNIDTLKEALG